MNAYSLFWPSRWWADVSTRDFVAAQHSGLAAATVAVLPVAATEQHGPHLPPLPCAAPFWNQSAALRSY